MNRIISDDASGYLNFYALEVPAFAAFFSAVLPSRPCGKKMSSKYRNFHGLFLMCVSCATASEQACPHLWFILGPDPTWAPGSHPPSPVPYLCLLIHVSGEPKPTCLKVLGQFLVSSNLKRILVCNKRGCQWTIRGETSARVQRSNKHHVRQG